MDKFIFLDFDGVLNSESNYRKMQMAGQPTKDNYGTIFDKTCVEALRNIIEATDADIVIASSWRYLLDLSTLREMWSVRGLPGHIHSITPVKFITNPFDSLTRGKEVEEWFKLHHQNEDNCPYIIIDDENEYMTKQLSHFVWTYPERGLCQQDTERAINILSNKKISQQQTTLFEWDEDLIWCPSRLYATVSTSRGEKYTLYLRWSYNDPWELYIYKEGHSETMVSISIPFYKDEQYKEAEVFAECWYNNNINNIEDLFSSDVR